MSENRNSGLKNNFYVIPEYVKDVDDLSEFLNLNGFGFNILKSLFGLNKSRHNATSPIRDSEKMVHYSIKNLLKLLRTKNKKLTVGDILIDVIDKLDELDKNKIKEFLDK